MRGRSGPKGGEIVVASDLIEMAELSPPDRSDFVHNDSAKRSVFNDLAGRVAMTHAVDGHVNDELWADLFEATRELQKTKPDIAHNLQQIRLNK